jgi:hypothetical protein
LSDEVASLLRWAQKLYTEEYAKWARLELGLAYFITGRESLAARDTKGGLPSQHLSSAKLASGMPRLWYGSPSSRFFDFDIGVDPVLTHTEWRQGQGNGDYRWNGVDDILQSMEILS